jgi:hypothetical protein
MKEHASSQGNNGFISTKAARAYGVVGLNTEVEISCVRSNEETGCIYIQLVGFMLDSSAAEIIAEVFDKCRYSMYTVPTGTPIHCKILPVLRRLKKLFDIVLKASVQDKAVCRRQ